MSANSTKRFIISAKTGNVWLWAGKDFSVQFPVRRDWRELAKLSLVRKARRKEIAVYYWTVNDPADMENVIGLGVDGIITDRPDILNPILDRMGY